MAVDLEKVKRIIATLDATQRAEIKKFIEDFNDATLQKRDSIKENFNKHLGPISSYSCPYCGK